MPNKTIYFFPDYRGGNPYQKLLYQPIKDIGYTVLPGSIQQVLKSSDNPSNIIFHMHWVNALFAKSTNESDAWAVVDSFIRDVTTFQSKGGKVMWTIHNHLPHENTFPEQDLRIRYFLCSQADRIHLHCGSHVEELDFLPLDPAKIAVHRHGSYIGYYGNFNILDRLKRIEIARPKAVFIGQIRKYKSVDRLLVIANELASKGIEVTIAGQPENDDLKVQIESKCKNNLIKCVLRRLTETEIHKLCTDSDIGIVSYERILTSGTLKLYLSYGMHIIAPNLTSISYKNRLKTFMLYEMDTNEFRFNYNEKTKDEYKKCFISSYCMAQELRWSASLFDL